MVLLIKFGKKEHLEQLKNGIVHFSPIEQFQEDPTDFRGDKMEGKHYIDTSKPFLINGTDISMYIEEAVVSSELNCPVCSFSASLLSYNNCHMVSEGEYAPNDDFIAEMRKFGDYFLVFNAFDFIDSLAKEFEITGCGYEYHPMVYIDKHNHELVRGYFDTKSEDQKSTAHLFVKDTSNAYPLQNEWRMIFLDHSNHYRLNGTSGINLRTDFSTRMPIFSTDQLGTLRCTEEYLYK